MNMIEKVALAMVRKAKAGPDEVHSLDAVQMSGSEDFIALAKTAIEAMRVPTPEMLDAVTAADQTEPFSNATVSGMFGEMIDAALEQK